MVKRSYLFVLVSAFFAACALGPPRAAEGGARHSAINSEAAAIAKQLLGVPYRYGGASPKGFDCSGLVYYAYGQAGAAVPRTTAALYRTAVPIDPRKARPGDLLFFQIGGRISHVGIYAGEGRFIHAPSSGKKVVSGRLDSPYWRDHLIAAGRLSAR